MMLRPHVLAVLLVAGCAGRAGLPTGMKGVDPATRTGAAASSPLLAETVIVPRRVVACPGEPEAAPKLLCRTTKTAGTGLVRGVTSLSCPAAGQTIATAAASPAAHFVFQAMASGGRYIVDDNGRTVVSTRRATNVASLDGQAALVWSGDNVLAVGDVCEQLPVKVGHNFVQLADDSLLFAAIGEPRATSVKRLPNGDVELTRYGLAADTESRPDVELVPVSAGLLGFSSGYRSPEHPGLQGIIQAGEVTPLMFAGARDVRFAGSPTGGVAGLWLEARPSRGHNTTDTLQVMMSVRGNVQRAMFVREQRPCVEPRGAATASTPTYSLGGQPTIFADADGHWFVAYTQAEGDCAFSWTSGEVSHMPPADRSLFARRPPPPPTRVTTLQQRQAWIVVIPVGPRGAGKPVRAALPADIDTTGSLHVRGPGAEVQLAFGNSLVALHREGLRQLADEYHRAPPQVPGRNPWFVEPEWSTPSAPPAITALRVEPGTAQAAVPLGAPTTSGTCETRALATASDQVVRRQLLLKCERQSAAAIATVGGEVVLNLDNYVTNGWAGRSPLRIASDLRVDVPPTGLVTFPEPPKLEGPPYKHRLVKPSATTEVFARDPSGSADITVVTPDGERLVATWPRGPGNQPRFDHIAATLDPQTGWPVVAATIDGALAVGWPDKPQYALTALAAQTWFPTRPQPLPIGAKTCGGGRSERTRHEFSWPALTTDASGDVWLSYIEKTYTQQVRTVDARQLGATPTDDLTVCGALVEASGASQTLVVGKLTRGGLATHVRQTLPGGLDDWKQVMMTSDGNRLHIAASGSHIYYAEITIPN